MFRLRRLILKLTVACGAIPLTFWLITLMVPMIGQSLGRSGHQIGSRYVVRFASGFQAIDIYRDKYPFMTIRFYPSEPAECLMLYGFLCLAVASMEGVIRLIERRNERRHGFEVLNPTAPMPSEPLPPLPPAFGSEAQARRGEGWGEGI
ncbi:MAG TPA: hypothetical protein VK797_19875 [Tepidisphaeraceae bacterium]|nr:hypothetical protein [Tepidisphaeraceae bacterium]